MSTKREDSPHACIVGAGLAGLLTAIEVREAHPDLSVVVLEKAHPESNTQIAGMRIRAKRAMNPTQSSEERERDVINLLAGQNDGTVTPAMHEFSNLLTQETADWNKRLRDINPDLVHEESSWFGPQWGTLNANAVGGRGVSILHTARTLALEHGVEFRAAEVTSLIRSGSEIRSLLYTDEHAEMQLHPQVVVLANGNGAGHIFESTNKSIRHSAVQLLFDAGLPIEGSTVTMWHPFGKCAQDHTGRVGCFETDNLATTDVFFLDGKRDDETIELLRSHQAHYHFPEITRRFVEHGGVVRLRDEHGQEQLARVSLHGSHIGGQTVDGTRVLGMSNLSVVGDAGGLLHWTNYKARLPGFALAHCLVSARKTADWIGQIHVHDAWNEITREERIPTQLKEKTVQSRLSERQIRETNTKHLIDLEFGSADLRQQVLEKWRSALSVFDQDSTVSLSLAILEAWSKRIRGEHEPILLENEMRHEHRDEIDNEMNQQTYDWARRL